MPQPCPAGLTFARWGFKDAYAADEAQAKETFRRLERGDQAAAAHETDKAKIRTEFITITQEVERVVEKPVYRDVCFDDDGLRLIGAAISGSAAASESAPAVPGPAGPGGR